MEYGTIHCQANGSKSAPHGVANSTSWQLFRVLKAEDQWSGFSSWWTGVSLTMAIKWQPLLVASEGKAKSCMGLQRATLSTPAPGAASWWLGERNNGRWQERGYLLTVRAV